MHISRLSALIIICILYYSRHFFMRRAVFAAKTKKRPIRLEPHIGAKDENVTSVSRSIRRLSDPDPYLLFRKSQRVDDPVTGVKIFAPTLDKTLIMVYNHITRFRSSAG